MFLSTPRKDAKTERLQYANEIKTSGALVPDVTGTTIGKKLKYRGNHKNRWYGGNHKKDGMEVITKKDSMETEEGRLSRLLPVF